MHANISTVLELPVPHIIQIELHAYYHVIFLEVRNDTFVDNILAKTGKTVAFVFNSHEYLLPISKGVEGVSIITLATLPHFFPNNIVHDYFSKYGQIMNIEMCTYSKCIYSTALQCLTVDPYT